MTLRVLPSVVRASLLAVHDHRYCTGMEQPAQSDGNLLKGSMGPSATAAPTQSARPRTNVPMTALTQPVAVRVAGPIQPAADARQEMLQGITTRKKAQIGARPPPTTSRKPTRTLDTSTDTDSSVEKPVKRGTKPSRLKKPKVAVTTTVADDDDLDSADLEALTARRSLGPAPAPPQAIQAAPVPAPAAPAPDAVPQLDETAQLRILVQQLQEQLAAQGARQEPVADVVDVTESVVLPVIPRRQLPREVPVLDRVLDTTVAPVAAPMVSVIEFCTARARFCFHSCCSGIGLLLCVRAGRQCSRDVYAYTCSELGHGYRVRWCGG
jgi:hypothetical protein